MQAIYSNGVVAGRSRTRLHTAPPFFLLSFSCYSSSRVWARARPRKPTGWLRQRPPRSTTAQARLPLRLAFQLNSRLFCTFFFSFLVLTRSLALCRPLDERRRSTSKTDLSLVCLLFFRPSPPHSSCCCSLTERELLSKGRRCCSILAARLLLVLLTPSGSQFLLLMPLLLEKWGWEARSQLG